MKLGLLGELLTVRNPTAPHDHYLFRGLSREVGGVPLRKSLYESQSVIRKYVCGGDDPRLTGPASKE